MLVIGKMLNKKKERKKDEFVSLTTRREPRGKGIFKNKEPSIICWYCKKISYLAARCPTR